MDTSMQNTPTATAGGASKPLWIAIGVLGAAVLAMGGTLAYKELRPQPAAEAVAAVPATEATAMTDKAGTAPAASPEAAKSVAAPAPSTKPPAPRPVAHNNAPRPADPSAYPSGSVGKVPATAAPAREVCLNCGTVDAVTPVERKGQTNGVGAVAGGVLGAIVGNQVGSGNGRAAATVLGALGGGYAGNAIEKNVKKDIVYQVRVRMEDGSVRNFEQKVAPAVGARVTVDGNTLRSSDGVAYSPAPAPAAAPVQSSAPAGSAY